MKLSIDPVGICRTFGFEDGLRIVKDAGFDNIDYDFVTNNPKAPLFDEDFRKRFADVAAIIKEIGLGCDETHSPYPSASSPPTVRYGDEMELSNPRFLGMTQTLEATAILGATKSVYHCLWAPDGGGSQQWKDFNYKYFKALEPYAKDAGVKIGIENMEKISGNMYKAEWLDELLDRLDSPQFYALIDLGHAAASETTPDAFLKGIKRGRVQGLHFNDYNTISAHFIPGLGITDWDKAAQALAEIGYEGDLAMEVGNTFKPFPKELVPEVIKFAAESGRIFIRKFEKAKAEIGQ